MSSVRVSRKALNKLNIVRIYSFSVLMGTAALLTTICLGVFDIFLLKPEVQTPLMVSFTLLLYVSAIIAYTFKRGRKTAWFKPFIYSFWGVFCLISTIMAYCAENPSKAIICHWMIMMAIGFVPVIEIKRFMMMWSVELAATLGLIFVQNFSSEGIISLITVNVMSILLNYVTYSNNIKNLAYKATLSDAITQAETDPMTRLLNRRGLEHRVKDIWPHCVRQKENIAVIMMDIDFFKKYNDTFGHAEGDECIKAVTAEILSSVRRRTDYAARVGGEEFLVMLTGIEPRQALQWSLMLKKRIEDLKIMHASDNFLPYVTVSMGLSCCQTGQGRSFEQIREEADRALYDAKYSGRACLSYNKKIYAQLNAYQYKKRANA